MKIFFALLLVTYTLAACKKDEAAAVSACGVRNPAQNLPWLKKLLDEERKNGTEWGLRVTAFQYKGTTYFNYNKAHMSCLLCVVHDCNGNILGIREVVPEEEYQDFMKAATGPSSVVVWKGKSAP
ncbi:hypothetical protein GCM10023091_40480 [Ravibacter arvi]|uniref:Uncharacterized protein n=1 Tax=Ravibacter arvi TaxID=2051041 RepID=A0ABP8MBS2_9BACT